MGINKQSNDAGQNSCCSSATGGPGYASPLEAMKNGPREKILYTTCIQSRIYKKGFHDYLATIDCDPNSPTYSQIIHRLECPYPNDEIHNLGWNVCSSCYGNNPTGAERKFLIMPGLESTNVYIVDVGTNPLEPRMHKVVLGTEIAEKCNLAKPHTIHCLPAANGSGGEIMLSCLGDRDGNGKCGFLLLDSQTFDIKGDWARNGALKADFNSDFTYQPRHNVMISTEFGSPNRIVKGFKLEDVLDKPGRPKLYGDTVNIWNWQEREVQQKIELGMDGKTPHEIRFMHDPARSDGYFSAIFAGAVFYFFKSKNDDQKFEVKKVIQLPIKGVEGWHMEKECGKTMGGLASDIILSLDDRWLYLSNFSHGEVRQYDISTPDAPRFAGSVFIGSVIAKDSGIKVISSGFGPNEGKFKNVATFDTTNEQPEPVVVKGKRVDGAPNMMQLSLDGKRMYVTTTLYTPWDWQFYPDMAERSGATMLLVDCDTNNGGMKLDEAFMIDFGKEPTGPVGAHEIRYPGGDCTSDVWI